LFASGVGAVRLAVLVLEVRREDAGRQLLLLEELVERAGGRDLQGVAPDEVARPLHDQLAGEALRRQLTLLTPAQVALDVNAVVRPVDRALGEQVAKDLGLRPAGVELFERPAQPALMRLRPLAVRV